MSIFSRIRDSIFGRKAEAATPAATPTAAPAPAQPSGAVPPPVATAPTATAATAPGTAATGAAPTATGSAAPAASGAASGAPAGTTAAAPPAAPVDVEAVLSALAARSQQKLNWRTSIVDLMKLLGMESSLAERRELAQELGYTGSTSDTATMNVWLHKQVMKKLAANGGKVPADLLD
jgi:hypothetical protein